MNNSQWKTELNVSSLHKIWCNLILLFLKSLYFISEVQKQMRTASPDDVCIYQMTFAFIRWRLHLSHYRKATQKEAVCCCLWSTRWLKPTRTRWRFFIHQRLFAFLFRNTLQCRWNTSSPPSRSFSFSNSNWFHVGFRGRAPCVESLAVNDDSILNLR